MLQGAELFLYLDKHQSKFGGLTILVSGGIPSQVLNGGGEGRGVAVPEVRGKLA